MKYKLKAEIVGETVREVWDNLLTLATNACTYKQEHDGEWPVMTSEGGGGYSVGKLSVVNCMEANSGNPSLEECNQQIAAQLEEDKANESSERMIGINGLHAKIYD